MIAKKTWLALISIYIMLIPCFFYQAANLRTVQEGAFQMATITLIFLSFCVTGQNRAFSGNKWIIAFGVYCVGSIIYYNFMVGTTILLNIFISLLLYIRLTQTLNKKDIKHIFKAIAAVCVINLAYILSQKFLNFDPIYRMMGQKEYLIEPVGFMGLRAHMGIYFAVCAPILAYFSRLLPAVCLFPLYLSVSTAAVAAFPCALLFAEWFRRRIWCVALAVVLIAGGAWYVVKVDNPMGMQTTRVTMWQDTLKMAMIKPLTGWGIDSFRCTWNDANHPQKGKNYAFFRVNNDTLKDKNMILSDDQVVKREIIDSPKDFWDNPHCEYLQVIYELGIPGFIILLMVLSHMIVRFRRAFKSKELIAVSGAIIGFLVASTTQFPFHVARIGYLFPILMALFVIASSDDDNEEKEVAYDR